MSPPRWAKRKILRTPCIIVVTDDAIDPDSPCAAPVQLHLGSLDPGQCVQPTREPTPPARPPPEEPETAKTEGEDRQGSSPVPPRRLHATVPAIGARGARPRPLGTDGLPACGEAPSDKLGSQSESRLFAKRVSYYEHKVHPPGVVMPPAAQPTSRCLAKLFVRAAITCNDVC